MPSLAKFSLLHILCLPNLEIFVQILPLWRGLLLDISRSYSLGAMITGLISTASISYLLGWLPKYCFSLWAVSNLYAGRQTVFTLCSLSSQLMGKKNLLTNGTVTVCQTTELQTVMLWELCQALSHIYVYLQMREGGEKKKAVFFYNHPGLHSQHVLQWRLKPTCIWPHLPFPLICSRVSTLNYFALLPFTVSLH